MKPISTTPISVTLICVTLLCVMGCTAPKPVRGWQLDPEQVAPIEEPDYVYTGTIFRVVEDVDDMG